MVPTRKRKNCYLNLFGFCHNNNRRGMSAIYQLLVISNINHLVKRLFCLEIPLFLSGVSFYNPPSKELMTALFLCT